MKYIPPLHGPHIQHKRYIRGINGARRGRGVKEIEEEIKEGRKSGRKRSERRTPAPDKSGDVMKVDEEKERWGRSGGWRKELERKTGGTREARGKEWGEERMRRRRWESM